MNIIITNVRAVDWDWVVSNANEIVAITPPHPHQVVYPHLVQHRRLAIVTIRKWYREDRNKLTTAKIRPAIRPTFNRYPNLNAAKTIQRRRTKISAIRVVPGINRLNCGESNYIRSIHQNAEIRMQPISIWPTFFHQTSCSARSTLYRSLW